MSHISLDLFYAKGSDYLIMADRYWGWPCVAKLTKTNTNSIINILLKWYSDFGFPLNIRTDGGPQFRTEFTNFCRQNSGNHQLASAHNPQSNGHAESMVKQVKHMILKSEDSLQKLLLHYRNTPRSTAFLQHNYFWEEKCWPISHAYPSMTIKKSMTDDPSKNTKFSKICSKCQFDPNKL